MIWLVIVIASFYAYMVSVMTFILFRQIRSACCSATDTTDRAKVLADFLVYSHANLTWFALSFVLVVMPFICLLMIKHTKPIEGQD